MDTKAFYTDEETKIEEKLSDLRRQKKLLKASLKALKKFYDDKISETQLRKTLKNLKYIKNIKAPIPTRDEVAIMKRTKQELNAAIKQEKGLLNSTLDGFSGIRSFREEFCSEKYVISIFESNLTRTLGIETDSLTSALIAVQVYHHRVFRDLICNGFLLNGEKFVPFTASAGQTRKKRFLFIKEALLQKHSGKLLCGLTIDRINDNGGINISKYLAYLGLNGTATDPWPEFDIDRCIVVRDFETDVTDLVDYIDPNLGEITCQKMAVPIPHTDGCGMILPSVSEKNFMVRLPWVKGLLASFPFDKFIQEASKSKNMVDCGIVKDIWGKEHDILAENIQIIFTKSQFKLHGHYSSWEEYKRYFKQYSCEAGICNMEEDDPAYTRTTYQTLQTLTDLTDEELTALAAKTVDKLAKLSSDCNTMLKVFGATKTNPRKTPFQKALMLYPELLQDSYCKETLRDIRDKIAREAVAGKLDIEGYYTFLLPDLYAFCQWLFLGEQIPSGLLKNGEVYCRLFEPGTELDCLRSPHLYKEHAVRTNVYKPNTRANRWFKTNAIYTSSHDLITRILMNDVDGDTSLVVANPTLVNAAKRNMENVAPLYYKLGKAAACQITPGSIYESVTTAYTGSNIGTPSNTLAKIWNIGPDANKYIDLIKFLVVEANATVDYPKTLYKPNWPEHINRATRDLLKGVKVPHFFIEAKDKEADQVAPINESCVNRIRKLIPASQRLEFNFKQLGELDWHVLTSKKRIPSNEITKQIVKTFCKRASAIELTSNKKDEIDWRWQCQKIREELLSIHSNINDIVNVLVRHLFSKENRRKKVFWECFGFEVWQNIKKNLGTDTITETIVCGICRHRVHRTGRSQKYCDKCAQDQHRKQKTASMQRSRAVCGHS